VSDEVKKKPVPQKPNRTTQPKPTQPPLSTTVQKDDFDSDDDFDVDLDAIARQATCPATIKTSVQHHSNKPTNRHEVVHPKADEMDLDFDDEMEIAARQQLLSKQPLVLPNRILN
jgi:azurin